LRWSAPAVRLESAITAAPATTGFKISMPFSSTTLRKSIPSYDARKLIFAGVQSCGMYIMVTTPALRSADDDTDSPAGIVTVIVVITFGIYLLPARCHHPVGVVQAKPRLSRMIQAT